MTRAVVAGALANKPHNGGEAWVRLSWVRGLQRLGVDTWFVEEASPDVPEADRRWFTEVAGRFGVGDRAALVDPGGRSLAGAPAGDLADALSGADVIFNISGNLTAEALLRLPRRRVYVDLDPGYTQFWHVQRLLGPVIDRHDSFLTVALSIGRDSCAIPTGDIDWLALPPPVVLDDWPAAPAPGDRRFTTVAAWRGGYGRVEHDGHVFGQKAHEFRRFADVPNRVPATCEVALDIHPADGADAELLRSGGWQLTDPRQVAPEPESFAGYVRESAAELSPAQGIYVETGSGWFSDRTTRYLASGRPAIVQDTGLPPEIPRGEGLLTFRTPEEAAAAARTVLEDYDLHARAARRIAEDHFDSGRVLARALEAA